MKQSDQKHSAKDIIVKPVTSQASRALCQKFHYSKSFVMNSQLHLGVFLDGKCEGVMAFGPSLDKRKMLGIVEGTEWNGFLELNRMAFSDKLPRNSESRALAIAFRLIRKSYPHIKWVISFADGTQCGDGTIYRASGFVLTQVKKNTSIWEMGGEKFTDISARLGSAVKKKVFSKTTLTKGSHMASSNGASSMKAFKDMGAKPLTGFQLRYIYFLDPAWKARLNCPIIPFSKIDEFGARMYKGERLGSKANVAPDFQSGEGGATPTPRLQSKADESTENYNVGAVQDSESKQ
jgi:hypothetical protein